MGKIWSPTCIVGYNHHKEARPGQPMKWPAQALQQTASRRSWPAPCLEMEVGGGSAVVLATRKAGSDLPYCLPPNLSPDRQTNAGNNKGTPSDRANITTENLTIRVDRSTTQQTDRQTERGENITSFTFGGGRNKTTIYTVNGN